jgi:hypothetical protein
MRKSPKRERINMTTTTNTLTAEMISQAKATLKSKFLAERAAVAAELHTQAEQAYEAYLENVKLAWVANWKSNNGSETASFKDLYDDYSGAEIFRASLRVEERIPMLLAVGEYVEATKCLIVRSGGTTTLAELRTFLAPHIPVDGTHTTVQDGRRFTDITPAFAAVLGPFTLERGGVVLWTKWRAYEPSEF